MSRLGDLYKAMETLRREKLSTDELEKQVGVLEENIIKTEILPALSTDIAPRLEPIKRDLVLVVEYHPGEPISVALSRKTKISEIIDAKTLTPRSSAPVKSENVTMVKSGLEPVRHVENFTKGIRVTFPNGKVIWHRAAINTFIETLREIGLERVSKVGIKHSGYNLVGKIKRPPEPNVIWQHESDGWYIYSNISNYKKKQDLESISKYYKLGLKIEEGKT